MSALRADLLFKCRKNLERCQQVLMTKHVLTRKAGDLKSPDGAP